MRTLCAMVSITCVSILAGCAGVPGIISTSSTPASNSVPGVALRGMVHGGENPVTGAHLYLYAAGTSGYGGASTSLLTSATGNPVDGNGDYYVITGAGGSFSISGDYTCPSASSQVYLYATGGNPGLTSGTNNTAAGLLAGLGSCGSLSSSTFIVINEVSTVVTAYAIAGYATDALHVSSPNNTLALQGVANAFAAAPNLEQVTVASGVSTFTGIANSTTPALLSRGTVPQAEINSLANILSACVGTSGSSSTPCSTLLSNAMNGSTEPADTATAAINIAHNPGVNVSTLFDLQTAGSPFQPDLAGAPNDWNLPIVFAGGNLLYPWGIAIDAGGNVWVVNHQEASVTELSPTGTPLSPVGGFVEGVTSGPTFVAIDSNDNVWITNEDQLGLSELNSSGTIISPSPNGFTAGGVDAADSVAIDASDNAWAPNYLANTLSELTPSGAGATGSPFSGGGLVGGLPVAIDAAGNVWVGDYYDTTNGLSEFSVSNGAPVSGTPFAVPGAEYGGPYDIAVDASNNVWVIDANDSFLDEFVASTRSWSANSPITTGGISGENPFALAIDGASNVWTANGNNSTLSEFNSSGTAISSSTGYTGGSATAALSEPDGIAIDGSGNVWIANIGNTVTEFIGAATPVVTPMVDNLRSPYGSHAVNKP